MSQAPAPTAAAPAQPPKSARAARPRKRHYGILLSFLLIVIAPLVVAAYYLYQIASDQYATTFGFAVRSEETSLANNLLGGLTSLSGGNSSSDMDILHEFIKSRTLVEKVDLRLNLSEIYSKPEFDPYFAYDPSGTLEELTAYWERVVHISYAAGSGLMEVRVNAFTAEDTLAVAEAIVEESTIMINELSAVARDDATRYAREDLDQAVSRLKTAREALTRFRSETRIVDPSADLQGQMGLLNSLEAQLAEAIIELNLLMETARENDPRVEQARRRITVTQTLIEEERQKFGIGGGQNTVGEQDYSTLVGEFERLSVDLKYAEESYLAARTALDGAIAEAQRQSRYLATYADPSKPQSSQYPKRLQLTILAGSICLMIWLVGLLVYYSLRDRA